MHLGISSFTYGWAVGVPDQVLKTPMNENDLMDLVRHFRLDTLQLGDNLPVHEFSRERLINLKQRASDEGIRLEIGARGMTRDHLLKYIEIATFLHAPLIRFITDDFLYEPSPQIAINTIYQILPDLERENLKLGIENHDRLKVKELALIMDSVNNKHVGICLDCVNSMGAGEGLEQVLDVLAPFTVNLHIKDYHTSRLPHKMGFVITGAPAGEGLTSIPFLLDKISLYHRCESAILEQWVPPEASIELTLEKEKQWAEQGIRYLKTLPRFSQYIKLY